MLKIRLQRIGRKNNPSYRVVVVDSKIAVKKGKPVELLGTYDTIRKMTVLNKERITYWISKGAQVSDTMHNILVVNGVIKGVKRNALPKKTPVQKEQKDEATEDSVKTDTAITNDTSGETVSADSGSNGAVVKNEEPMTEKNDTAVSSVDIADNSTQNKKKNPSEEG